MTMTKSLALAALSIALAASGCGGSAVDSRRGGEMTGDADGDNGERGVCSSHASGGLKVTVIHGAWPPPDDAATSNPPCLVPVTATNGNYTETLQCFGGFPRAVDCTCFAALERPGTYSVEARFGLDHPLFLSLSIVGERGDVIVGSDECAIPESVIFFGGTEQRCDWLNAVRKEALVAAGSCTRPAPSGEEECEVHSTVLDECGCSALVNAQATELIVAAEEARATWATQCAPPATCSDGCPIPPPSLPTCGNDRGAGRCMY